MNSDDVLQAYQLLGTLIKEQYGIDPTGKTIPSGIFRAKLPPFSALVTYLNQIGKEDKEIARLLRRNRSFVKQSIKKKKVSPKGIPLPLEIFRQDLSILEAAVVHLTKQGLRQHEIATELNKSPAAIWTILQRAKAKGVRL